MSDWHAEAGAKGARRQRATASAQEQSQWGRKGAHKTWGGVPPVTCELCGAILYYWPRSENPPTDPLDEAADAIAAHLRADHRFEGHGIMGTL